MWNCVNLKILTLVIESRSHAWYGFITRSNNGSRGHSRIWRDKHFYFLSYLRQCTLSLRGISAYCPERRLYLEPIYWIPSKHQSNDLVLRIAMRTHKFKLARGLTEDIQEAKQVHRVLKLNDGANWLAATIEKISIKKRGMSVTFQVILNQVRKTAQIQGITQG